MRYRSAPLSLLLVALFLPVVAFAQDVAADPTTQQILELIKYAGGSFKAGLWFSGVVAILVAVVFLIRLFGKKAHEAIADDSIWDKPFWFMFDTKPGGILLNALTACAVVLAPLMLAGQVMTPALAGVTLSASVGASTIWGWVKDLYEWWKTRKSSDAPAKSAGVAAGNDPGPTVNG